MQSASTLQPPALICPSKNVLSYGNSRRLALARPFILPLCRRAIESIPPAAAALLFKGAVPGGLDEAECASKMRFVPNPVEEPIRVLVADNTRIHAQSLADALRRDRRLQVVGAVSHGRDLLGAATSQEVDVGVVSCNLDAEPGRGLEVVRELKAERPQIRFVVLLDSSKRDLVLDAFRAGARGLFSRHESLETLSKCVRRVYEGQVWASSEQVTFAVEALASSPTVRTAAAAELQSLSRREMDVVRCIMQGLTNREIAEQLGLSQHTIKNYLFRVFDKLGISSRLELMSLAMAQPAGGQASGANGDTTKPAAQGSFDDCKLAAEKGDPTAQAALAAMYASGNGVEKDLVAAYAWFLQAEKTNAAMNEELGEARKQFAGLLSAEQIAEAQRQAEERFSTAKRPALSMLGLGTAAGSGQ